MPQCQNRQFAFSSPAVVDGQAIHGTWRDQVGCTVSSLTRCLSRPLHGTWPSTIVGEDEQALLRSVCQRPSRRRIIPRSPWDLNCRRVDARKHPGVGETTYRKNATSM